jgi:hypothetical protein
LERRLVREAAISTREEEWVAALTSVERFEQSLSPSRRKSWLVAFAVAVFFAAFVLANFGFKAEGASRLLIGLTQAAAKLSWQDVVELFDPPTQARAEGAHSPAVLVVFGAIWICMYAAWIVLLPVSSSYRLERTLVAVAARTKATLKDAKLTDAPDEGSISKLEAKVFDDLGLRPLWPRSFDLLVQAILVVPLAVIGGAGLVGLLTHPGPGPSFERLATGLFLASGVAAVLVVGAAWRARLRLRPIIPQGAGVLRGPIAYAIGLAPTGALLLNVIMVYGFAQGRVFA